MSDYLPRSDILTDLKTRILAPGPLTLAGDRVYVARVTGLPENKFPAVLIYAPTRDFEAVGAAWEWSGPVTLAVEIQCRYSDDLGAGAWAAQAEAIGDEILSRLIGDAAWRRLWRGPPSIRVQQYLRRENVAVPHVGETITLTLTPRAALVIPLAHAAMTGADVEITIPRGGEIPADPDLSLTLEPES